MPRRRFSGGRQTPLRLRSEYFVRDEDVSLIGSLESCNAAKRRRLSATAGTQQGNEFTLAHSETDAVYRQGFRTEAFDQILYGYFRHAEVLFMSAMYMLVILLILI